MMEIDSDQQKKAQKKQEIENIVKKVFNEILEKYKMMIDQIDNEHFNPLDDVMKHEMNKQFDVNKAGEVFKKKLYEIIEKRFTAMWQDLDMDTCLAMLEVSKKSTEANTSNWRPGNQSTEDLVRPYLMRFLVRKKKFLQEQIGIQEKQIADMVMEIERVRKIFQSQKDKRARLLAQIEIDSQKINEAHSRIDEINDSNNAQ